MLGVAWPSLRLDFARPVGALGVLVTGSTVGYLLTSLVIGALVARFGYAAVLVSSGLAMALGGLTMALAPLWILVLLGTLFLGAGVGLLDAGLNAYAAHHFNSRQLNWLHAGFGVGATVGPIIMSGFLRTDLSWRGGYLALAVVAVLTALVFLLSRRRWREPSAETGDEATESSGHTGAVGETGGRSRGGGLRDLRDPVVLGSALIFVLYAGMEVTAGQWAYSLFTLERGVAAGRAARWVSLYWGALTVGRVLFGFIAEAIGTVRLLRLTMAGAAVGIVLFWIGTPVVLGAVGLLLLGFSLAPMFPLLIGETPLRVGSHRASFVVGLQMAGSSMGVMALAGGIGLVVEALSLAVLGPALVLILSLYVLTHEAVLRGARRAARRRGASASISGET
jgi:fucose permease